MCYWKQWRHQRTKVRKLMELGIPKDFAIITGASSKSYWHLSKSYATNAAMSNKLLEEQDWSRALLAARPCNRGGVGLVAPG